MPHDTQVGRLRRRALNAPADHPAFGFNRFVYSYINDYNNITNAVIKQIVNYNQRSNFAIRTSLNQKQVMVAHIIDYLASRGLLEVTKYIGGRADIDSVSVELKRLARDL
jgi:hypothetical protein